MDQPSSLRRDISSAYVASGAKIVSWVVVSAIVFRIGGPREFGILALVRGTIGILSYVSLGLGPALVKLMAEARARPQDLGDEAAGADVLSYYNPQRYSEAANIYSNGMSFAALAALIGFCLVIGYSLAFPRIHWVPWVLGRSAVYTTLFIGIGLLMRLVSEAPAAMLQTSGRIARDNWLVAEAEALWAMASALLIFWNVVGAKSIVNAGIGYGISGLFLLIRRALAARGMGMPFFRLDGPIIGRIVAIGGMITLAQLADYLYAPTDYILINRFLGARVVAVYAPAVQLDAGLLLLVSGLAAVLFPRSALAHAAGDAGAVRQYYFAGTMISFAILVAGAVGVWALAPSIFRLWLGNPMLETRVILPLVLIHTIIGGSSMVGRSILLGIGRFKPFTISVLLAGVINVFFSYIFVKYFQLGLKGIIYGTIIAVVVRCVLWMPWYVMWSLREVKELPVQPMATPEI